MMVNLTLFRLHLWKLSQNLSSISLLWAPIMLKPYQYTITTIKYIVPVRLEQKQNIVSKKKC